MRDQITGLSRHYEVAALDLRGYNLSDKPQGVDQYGFRYLVPDAPVTLVMLPGIGHFIQRDAPTLVTKSIKRWLDAARAER